MTVRRIAVVLTCAGCMAVSSIAHAQTRSAQTSRATVTWTIGGAGAGFGVGLWAGLSAFDDAINSERKVWATAVVGAAVGAVGGYLIGKARARNSGSPALRPDAGFPTVEFRGSLGHDPVLPTVRSIRELRTLSPASGLGLVRSAASPARSTSVCTR
jgi:hypothetical protein